MSLGGLAKQEAVVINQRTSFLDNCLKCCGVCCADFENVYDVSYGSNGHGKELVIKEESGCCARVACNPYHALSLKITASGNDVAEIEKPFKCCCPAILPCFLKEATVFRIDRGEKKEVGYIQQPYCGGFLEPELNLYDRKGGELTGRVKGPCVCLGGLCSSNFKFYDNNGIEHAKIKRDGVAGRGIVRATATTSDRYELTFEDQKMPIEEKLRVVATAVFLDYLFFEGETDCICVLCTCPPQLWFKLCDLYCCGALVPCRFKCCIKEMVEQGVKAETGL